MTEVYDRPAEHSPFIEGTAIQFAWDSTSLGWLMQCPQLYQYQMIQGWFPKGVNPHLNFGLIYHSALETYDRLRVKGVSFEEAQIEMVRHALEKTGEYHDRVLNLDDSADMSAANDPSLNIIQKDGKTILRKWRPWISEHSVKNRENLIRTLVWYTEYYKDDPAKTYVLANGEAAVELSFRFEIELLSPNGQPYMLSGHLDKVVEFGGDLLVQDKKTSGHQLNDMFFASFDLNNQMSLYTVAGKLVLKAPIKGVMIDGAQVAVGFSAFLRGLTFRTDEKLNEWLDTIQTLLRQNEDYATRGSWPRNYQSCNNYMDSKGLGGCPFKKVCSRQPSQRESVLKTDFVKKRWNPLVPRTEDSSTR